MKRLHEDSGNAKRKPSLLVCRDRDNNHATSFSIPYAVGGSGGACYLKGIQTENLLP